MFSRTLQGLSRVGRQGIPEGIHKTAVRTVTIKAMKDRIKAVKNIEKITVAMKMVAVCKLRNSENATNAARAFDRDLVAFWPELEKEPEIKEHAWVAVTGDKGLCGGANVTVTRAIRDNLNNLLIKKPNENHQIFLIGSKGEVTLRSKFSQFFTTLLADNGKFKQVTFKQVGRITDELLAHKFDKVDLYCQIFKSAIAYETTNVPIWSFESIENDVENMLRPRKIRGPRDTYRNLYEFKTALQIQRAMAETETSVISARMAAMDNSSKNAGEMADSLTTLMNRTRQAKITTELVEIIAGVTAAEENAGS